MLNIIHNDRNYLIDTYRVMIIAWIILFHYTCRYNEYLIDKNSLYFKYTFDNGGEIGVLLFFMISGFFLAKRILREEGGGNSYVFFCINRYLRLWSYYVIACFFIYIWMFALPISDNYISVFEFGINLFFLYHPNVDYVDGAHWFLSTYIISQLCFGLFLLVETKYRVFLFYIISIVTFFVYVFSCYKSINPSIDFWAKIFFYVIIGVGLFNYKKNFLILMMYGGFVLYLSLQTFILICLFFLLTRIHLKSELKIARYLGEVSFSWYLVHQYIGYSIMYNLASIIGSNFLCLLTAIIVTLLLALIVDSWGRKLFSLSDKLIKSYVHI